MLYLFDSRLFFRMALAGVMKKRAWDFHLLHHLNEYLPEDRDVVLISSAHLDMAAFLQFMIELRSSKKHCYVIVYGEHSHKLAYILETLGAGSLSLDYLHHLLQQTALGDGSLLGAGSFEQTKVLSLTEMTVLKFIASGHSLGEIAKIRFRSIKTVSAQKRSILDKLGVQSTMELLSAFHSSLSI
ncbi:DNA-binding response regulator [Enterobacteriaceae bacterium 89]|nr:DNA-binding response regulator [Enterobacteriaceae bacterium 89]